MMKMALAGTGRPRKDVDCLVSRLNFASRSAENATINNDKYGTSDRTKLLVVSIEALSNKNMNKAGTRPKEITSASESISLPMGDLALSSLATKPSKKSKTAANPIKPAASRNNSLKRKITANEPHSKFNTVMVFGR